MKQREIIQEGGMKRTQDIIAEAATTGNVNSEIGMIVCNTSGIRSTWKLDDKQITFKKLYDKLENRKHGGRDEK